ncbi:MAG: helix-turn-helix domain-containing protein [Bacteroidota bacterium]
MNNIKQIEQIAELYEYASLECLPVHNNFDILFFSDFQSNAKKMLPPHRRKFFTVIFFEDQKGGRVNVNEKSHQRLTNAVLFQGEEHVFSFVRDENVKGCILLFKPSFLLPQIKEADFQYPFFSLLNQNLFHLNEEEHRAFNDLLSVMNTEKKNKEIVKYLLLSLLEKCLLLSQTYATEEQYVSKKYRLARHFKRLVNNYFQSKKQVDFYAQKLNITANHLNEVVKSQTDKTAKRHILDRTLLEAQNLLRYTNMDIAEIAYALNFSETTHFNRFFKKETQITPKSYRQQNP